jgi:hypothetical protein
MPKPGFKSITVSENVYNKFFQSYERSRSGLELKGITSFSGYLTSLMEEVMLKNETFAKHSPYIEKLSIEGNVIILRDNKVNRIVEIALENGELRCLLDQKKDCIHIGFVYSLPQVYEILVEKTILANKQ